MSAELASLGQVAAARTVGFSGVTDAQLRSDVLEYLIVYGCLSALAAAAVAVTVGVGDTA